MLDLFCRLRSSLFLFATFVLLVSASAADQGSAVYRVTDGDRQLYLGGTIHLLRQSDYPLPAAYEEAYADSGIIALETDMGAVNDPSLQMRMMERVTYQDGRTLRSVLNDEAYTALENHLAEAGLPMQMVESFKPGLLMTTLSVLEFQKLGFTPQGVDMFYFTRAMGDGKAMRELEPVDAQIDMLASMGEGYESEYVLYSLEDFENSADSIEELVRVWREADLDAMEEVFIEPMREMSSALYEDILVTRNHAWIPVIEELVQEEETVFVLVGAAHLPGADGLLTLLSERGYSIEPL